MSEHLKAKHGSRYDRLQGRVYFLLESPAKENTARKIVIYFIAGMILLNVAAVILETENKIFIEYAPYFHLIDFVCVVVFSIEYVLRVWCCVRNPAYSLPVTGRLHYMMSPLALIDLLAITPFYLPFIIPVELRLLRLLRLLRIFRVLKLGRYSNAFDTFAAVLKEKKEEIVIAVIMASLVLVLSSSAMYFVEHEAQPEKFSSIPGSMWWGVETLTTVGYGDVYPVTAAGRVISAIVALSSIGLFALPAAILASGFVESIKKRHAKHSTTIIICPRCKEEIDLHPDMVPGISNNDVEAAPHSHTKKRMD
ncbi:MAG: ion transporter [Methanoregula sp.]|nr:MAG: ion transporter [Methanoregula sp.]